MIENLTELGEEIKRKRKEKGMSLRQVAEKIGCTTPLVWQWENAVTEPKASSLIALNKAIGLDLFSPNRKIKANDSNSKKAK